MDYALLPFTSSLRCSIIAALSNSREWKMSRKGTLSGAAMVSSNFDASFVLVLLVVLVKVVEVLVLIVVVLFALISLLSFAALSSFVLQH